MANALSDYSMLEGLVSMGGEQPRLSELVLANNLFVHNLLFGFTSAWLATSGGAATALWNGTDTAAGAAGTNSLKLSSPFSTAQTDAGSAAQDWGALIVTPITGNATGYYYQITPVATDTNQIDDIPIVWYDATGTEVDDVVYLALAIGTRKSLQTTAAGTPIHAVTSLQQKLALLGGTQS